MADYKERAMEIAVTGDQDAIERLFAEIERLTRGITEIQEYLNATEPRVGDASFCCDALLASH